MSIKRILLLIAILFVSFIGYQLYSFQKLTVTSHPSEVDKQVELYTISIKGVNIHVIKKADKVILVDAGNPGDGPMIVKGLEELGIDPAEVDLLIVTHGHQDHAGSAAFLQKEYNIKIMAGLGDEELLREGRIDSICPTGFMAEMIMASNDNTNYDPIIADHYIQDTLFLDKMNLMGTVLPQPGHTDGSIIYLIENAVFVGDLLTGEPLNPTKPAVHFFMCDLEDNANNIKQLLTNDHITHWYPGHFGPFELDELKAFAKKL